MIRQTTSRLSDGHLGGRIAAADALGIDEATADHLEEEAGEEGVAGPRRVADLLRRPLVDGRAPDAAPSGANDVPPAARHHHHALLQIGPVKRHVCVCKSSLRESYLGKIIIIFYFSFFFYDYKIGILCIYLCLKM